MKIQSTSRTSGSRTVPTRRAPSARSMPPSPGRRDGIKQSVQNAIPVLGPFVTNTVTTHPTDGTVELKGMLDNITAKPVVSGNGLQLQIVSFNALGFHHAQGVRAVARWTSSPPTDQELPAGHPRRQRAGHRYRCGEPLLDPERHHPAPATTRTPASPTCDVGRPQLSPSSTARVPDRPEPGGAGVQHRERRRRRCGCRRWPSPRAARRRSRPSARPHAPMPRPRDETRSTS